MWVDVNIKTVKGLLFRKFRHNMMGVPVKCDDDLERRNTHPMLMPKVENEGLIPDERFLKEIEVLAPAKRVAALGKTSKRGQSRGDKIELISLRFKGAAKQRSVLGEKIYGPGSGPQ